MVLSKNLHLSKVSNQLNPMKKLLTLVITIIFCTTSLADDDTYCSIDGISTQEQLTSLCPNLEEGGVLLVDSGHAHIFCEWDKQLVISDYWISCIFRGEARKGRGFR